MESMAALRHRPIESGVGPCRLGGLRSCEAASVFGYGHCACTQQCDPCASTYLDSNETPVSCKDIFSLAAALEAPGSA